MFDVDDVFCCLGTTLKQAKTKAMQTKIDRDYCITIAKLASQMTCEHFILVSSIGANALSKSFYLRLKGELEDAVKTCSFKQCYIFQPSVLLGLRKTFRLGEYISKVVLLCLTPFLIGPFAKFRAISALMLAKAMTNAAKLGSDSATFTYNDIKTYAKSEINE